MGQQGETRGLCFGQRGVGDHNAKRGVDGKPARQAVGLHMVRGSDKASAHGIACPRQDLACMHVQHVPQGVYHYQGANGGAPGDAGAPRAYA